MTGIVARALLVIAIACLAGAAALAFSSSQPKEYLAVSRFAFGRLLSPELQVLGAGFGEPDVEEDIRTLTESDIMNADEIAEATARAHPELGFTGGEIAGRVAAIPSRGTLVVDLRARASSPELAARLVTAYGEQYLELRRARERRQATAVQRVLQRRLARMSERERATLAGSNLQGHIDDLEVLRIRGTNNPQIIAGARASGAAVSPNTQRNVVFAVVLGLVVGVGLVALRSEGRSRSRVAAARRAAAARTRGDPIDPR